MITRSGAKKGMGQNRNGEQWDYFGSNPQLHQIKWNMVESGRGGKLSYRKYVLKSP